MKDEKVFELFKEKLKKEFPDLQGIKLVDMDGARVIFLELDSYSTEGMNNLDDAVKKVIKKYFKLFLKVIRDEDFDKYAIDYTEEIVILIL